VWKPLPISAILKPGGGLLFATNLAFTFMLSRSMFVVHANRTYYSIKGPVKGLREHNQQASIEEAADDGEYELVFET
jgi:hypothetical protein